MKKILYLLIFTITSLIASSLDFNGPPQYSTKDGKVYYEVYPTYKEIEGVDVSTFEELLYGYAKDSKYIYYMGQAVEGADVKSFFVLDKGSVFDHNAYAIDKYKVYFGGKAIEGVDLATFEVFDDKIARDEFSVYYSGNKLSNIDIKTFSYIGRLCSNDMWCRFSISVFKDKNGEYRTDDEDFDKKFVVE